MLGDACGDATHAEIVAMASRRRQALWTRPRRRLSVARAVRALFFGDLPSMVGPWGTGCTLLWSQRVWPVAAARRSTQCRTILTILCAPQSAKPQEGRDTRRLSLRGWCGLGGSRCEIESGVRRVVAATMAYHGLRAWWREAGAAARPSASRVFAEVLLDIIREAHVSVCRCHGTCVAVAFRADC